MLTQARLKEVLNYDPETGIFVWIKKTGDKHKIKLGAKAGSVMSGRYLRIGIDGAVYCASRLTWFYIHGVWPLNEIDHINGFRSDNRLVNLREVIHSINTQNRRQAKNNNKTGFLGVAVDKKTFRASIMLDYKYIHLGNFLTPEEAHAAYLSAKRNMHIGCTI